MTKTQIRRLMKRYGLSRAEIERRIKSEGVTWESSQPSVIMLVSEYLGA